MKIPFTKFIQRLCDNKSARIANVTVKATGGAFVPTTYFIEQELAKVETLNFRSVEHRQTNAIRFVGGSWLMFDRPKHTNRQCYSISIGETEYLLMVTHREPYTNLRTILDLTGDNRIPQTHRAVEDALFQTKELLNAISSIKNNLMQNH